MHTPKNYQPSTKKLYYLISFVLINFKILILIDNYIYYKVKVF